MERDELVERVALLPDGNAWPSTIELLCDLRDQIEADGKRIAELEAQLAERDTSLKRLHTIILENNPDTTIADNGMTVWDGLRNEARAMQEARDGQ